MSASNTQGNAQILIASGNADLTDRYTDVLDNDYCVSVSCAASETMLLLKQQLPQLVMLDPSLFKDDINSAILEITATSPLSRIVVIENSTDCSLDQMELFKTGAHGFLADNISPALLLKAVQSISIGEVWVPRKLITRLIAELASKKAANAKKPDPAARESMSKLTPRELEVAQMVHSGGNNKTIARQLAISERTVKAHLSAIFRKLNIANRLHLALFFNELT